MRDARTMNHMDPETKLVHARLEEWGKWAKDIADSNGLPPITVIGRMMEYGPLGAAQAGRPPVSLPDRVAAIDGAVARLCEIDRRGIKEYYLKWQPIEVSARHLSKSVRQFQTILKRARWRIAFDLARFENSVQ